MGIEDLIHTIEELPPARRAQVVDFVAYLREQEAHADDGLPGTSGDTMLDAIAADPVARDRFAASIERANEEMDRGAGRSLDEVAARLRARSKQHRRAE